MPKKLLDFSEKMFQHIEDFQHHYKISSNAEAIRTLILAGFENYGNPLAGESPRRIVGKIGKETNLNIERSEEVLHKERYDKIMRDMGHEV